MVTGLGARFSLTSAEGVEFCSLQCSMQTTDTRMMQIKICIG